MVRASAASQVASASYADLANSAMFLTMATRFSYTLACINQDCKYKILGSNDDFATSVEVVAETAITAGATVGVTGDAHYLYYKVQIIEGAVAGGSVSAEGVAK